MESAQVWLRQIVISHNCSSYFTLVEIDPRDSKKKKKENIIILKFVKQWKVVYFDTLI